MAVQNVSPSDLAVNGGKKAVEKFDAQESRFGMLVGNDEFMALADLWGYSDAANAAIRGAINSEEHHVKSQLTRYYNPQPSRVAQFEALIREMFSVKYALGVNSGTSALMAAYTAAGIGPGMEVIVPAYTFFATVSAAVACKAIPVIAEIDDSMTIDPADVERKITPQTKAIVPVHMVGNACNMEAIMALARKHNLMVIEDTAQACGGKFKGQFLGTIGNLGCFSISTYKVVGAGEAGMVLTNDEYLYTRATSQHDTAACWRPDRYAKERQPGELFCGENYRLSEMEGAVLIPQFQKMQKELWRYNANLRKVVDNLGQFAKTKVRRSNDPQGDVGYSLGLIAENKVAAEKIAAALTAEGVGAGARGTRGSRDWHIYSYWEQVLEQKTPTDEGCPFTCPYYKGTLPAYSPDMCPRSADLFDRAVHIGINQFWSEQDCLKVSAAINKVCGALG
jgi:8-amino-3,8-dideoxy-alpha-D-manno-octulosonate transaminase